MSLKQRAIADEDKEERRRALLDAAEALFLEHPDRMASVAEVAAAAGLAKGTVYLYFPGKEEMLLALHERHVAHYFDALMALLDATRPAGFDEVWEVTRDQLIRVPGCLSLTSRCFGLMDRDIPTEAAIAFKIRVGPGAHRRRRRPRAPLPGAAQGRGRGPPAAQLRPHRRALAAAAPDRALRHRDGTRRARDVQARLRARGRAGAARAVARRRWTARSRAAARRRAR